MSDKHTPGPWLVTGGTFVYALNDYGTNTFWANIYAGSQGGYKSAATSSEEIEANANLIAAAPDLLEALEGFANAEFEPADANGSWGSITITAEDWQIAKKAIARARGQS